MATRSASQTMEPTAVVAEAEQVIRDATKPRTPAVEIARMLIGEVLPKMFALKSLRPGVRAQLLQEFGSVREAMMADKPNYYNIVEVCNRIQARGRIASAEMMFSRLRSPNKDLEVTLS